MLMGGGGGGGTEKEGRLGVLGNFWRHLYETVFSPLDCACFILVGNKISKKFKKVRLYMQRRVELAF